MSAILHNLLVYMLMVGLTPHETTENIHRFSARTRLAIIEEKLLQRTMKHIEECIEEDVSTRFFDSSILKRSIYWGKGEVYLLG